MYLGFMDQLVALILHNLSNNVAAHRQNKEATNK